MFIMIITIFLFRVILSLFWNQNYLDNHNFHHYHCRNKKYLHRTFSVSVRFNNIPHCFSFIIEADVFLLYQVFF